MIRHLSALASGLLFGLGLVISGMVNPAKVKNFLDLAGTWDPSLLFVMAGAIAVTLPGYRLLSQSKQPLFSSAFQWPTTKDIDAPLIKGAILFGVGWALSGLCPGPALTALPTASPGVLGFVVMLVVGTLVAYHQKRLSAEGMAERFPEDAAKNTTEEPA